MSMNITMTLYGTVYTDVIETRGEQIIFIVLQVE